MAMLRLDFADLNGTPPSGFGKNSSARQYFHFVINDIIRDGFGYNPDGTPKNNPFINDGFDTLNDAIDELQTSESPQFEAMRGLFATEMGGLTTSINFQECREEFAPSGFNNLFFQEFYHFDLEAFGCRTGDLITDVKFHIPVAEHCDREWEICGQTFILMVQFFGVRCLKGMSIEPLVNILC